MKTDQPEKLDLRSFDVAGDRRRELLRLFPEIRADGGQLDLERLRLALGEAVDAGRERFGLTWPGKTDCFRTIQTPSLGALRPCREESVEFDATGNLILEGENLEVLKLLQKSYLGRVKLIYIDPPYNTGKDFVYPDNYSESLRSYLEYTGQVDSTGQRFGTNADTSGRFHSKWLNMMYPRLYLARNLLREDGVIFVSIDEAELVNLRALLNEVFGETNLVGVIVWRTATDNNPTQIATDHEYVVCYARNKLALDTWELPSDRAEVLRQQYFELRRAHGDDLAAIQKALRAWIRAQVKSGDQDLDGVSHYSYVDERGIYYPGNSANTRAGGYDFDVVHPETGGVCARPENGFRWPESTFREAEKAGEVHWGPDHSSVPKIKKRLESATQLLKSSYYEDNRGSTKELTQLLGAKVFDNPKSPLLLRRLLGFTTGGDDLVLDFFAGSGTTAQAVLDLNEQDGGNRKFILVQLPEPTGRDDFPTIAEITKERVRRTIDRMKAEGAGDRGFRVFKLDESSFTAWEADRSKDAAALTRQLELHVDHIRAGRSTEDLLYEILLKSGFPLTTPVEAVELADKNVHAVDAGRLLVCLERELSIALVRAMAARGPERVVYLDEGFAGNDQLKANAVQVFKAAGVTSFRTV